MKRLLVYLFLTTIFISSCKRNTKTNYAEESIDLAEEILVDYLMLPKSSDLSISELYSNKFNSILAKIDTLKKTKYGKDNALNITIAEFKVLYLSNQKHKAFSKIAEIKNSELINIKNLYTGVYLELENNKKQALVSFKKVFHNLKEQGINESNCSNYNTIIILADMKDYEFKDCDIEPLPKDYFIELRKKDRKKFIKDHFFNSFEL